MFRYGMSILGLMVTGSLLLSQESAKDVQELITLFKQERSEAEKTFQPGEMTIADELAAKAEKQLAAGNISAASRTITEARWQVPFLPDGLPENVSRVLGFGRLRHGDRINAIKYSPDGQSVASCSKDGTVRIWNIGNSRQILIYRGHEGTKPEVVTEDKDVFFVSDVAFSPDGLWIASCAYDQIHIWEAKTGKVVHRLEAKNAAFKSIAFGKTKNTILSGGDDKSLRLWDVAKQEATFVQDPQPMPINSVCFSPDAARFASVNEGGDLMVYQVTAEEPKLLLSIEIEQDSINTVAFSSDGTSIYSGGNKTGINRTAGPGGAYGTAEGALVRQYSGHSRAITGVANSVDGKLLVSCAEDGSILVWEADTSKQLRAFKGHASEVTAVAIRPDMKQVASAGADGAIRIWALNTVDEHRVFSEAKDNLWTVAFDPTGQVFASAGADRAIRIYDAETGKLTKTLTGHQRAITAIVFPSKDRLISVGGDNAVKIWDLSTDKSQDCQGHTLAILGLTLSLDGQLLYTVSADKTLRIWDAAKGQLLGTWQGKSAACCVAVRPKTAMVIVGTADGRLNVIDCQDTAQPKLVESIAGHQFGVACVDFKSNGSQLATGGGDGVVRIWEMNPQSVPVAKIQLNSPTKAGTGGTPSPITAVAYSQDDKVLAGAGAEGVVRLWDSTTGAEIRALRGHGGWITSLAFSPDQRAILSCSVDESVRMFDLPRNETTVSPSHLLATACIAVSRDGKYAATGSYDRTVKIWDLKTGKEVRTLIGSGDPKTVRSVAFYGPDQLVSTGSDKLVRWFNLKDGKETRVAATEEGFVLATGPDAKKVGLAWVVSVKEGEVRSGFQIFKEGNDTPENLSTENITSAAISPDAEWGLNGFANGNIRIYDLTNKKPITPDDWNIHSEAVADIAVTPDRKTVFVIDVNGSVKIADVAKREVLKTIQALDGDVNGLMVAPTGDKFAVLSAQRDIKVFNTDGKLLRSWKMPYAPNACVFTIDGKNLLTANQDGTAFVLDLPKE